MRFLKNVLNILSFQAAWWGLFFVAQSILVQNWRTPLLLMCLISVVYFFVQLKYLSTEPILDLQVAAKGLALGVLLDGTMFLTGLIQPGGSLNGWSRDCQWIVLLVSFVFLWTTFSLTLNSMVKMFRGNHFLFMGFCAFFGPITYFGPERVYFLAYSEPRYAALAVHGILWAAWAGLLLVPVPENHWRFCRAIK